MSLSKEHLASRFRMSAIIEHDPEGGENPSGLLPENFWRETQAKESVFAFIDSLNTEIAACVPQAVENRMEQMKQYFSRLHGSKLAIQRGDQVQSFDYVGKTDVLSKPSEALILINPWFFTNAYLVVSESEAITQEITEVFTKYLATLRRIYRLTIKKNTQETLTVAKREKLATDISLLKLELIKLENVGKTWGISKDLETLKKAVEDKAQNFLTS